jgi:UDP-glucuronate decarboxylase
MIESNSIIQSDLEQIVISDLPWTGLSDMTVLITGGSGFLASYLVKSLLEASDQYNLNLKLICVVRSLNSVKARLTDYLTHPGLNIVVQDISRPFPTDFPAANAIIHSASQASPRYYGLDPVGTLMANTVGTVHLLNHAVKCQSTNFLFFSSGEVYGVQSDPDLLVTEDDYGYVDPLDVRSCYAESKRVGETMCTAWSEQYGLHTTVVRPFHTYGPNIALDDGRVFADFVADVVARHDIVLKSDGLAQRPFCYISDATVGFLTVLLKGKTAEAYNVANPNAEISIRNLAHVVADLLPERAVKVRFDISTDKKSYLKSPISRQRPCIDKISQLGWTPKIGISEGFERTIQSFL